MWIDTHCHLNSEEFSNNLAETIDQLSAYQVSHAIVIGIDLSTSIQAVQIAEQYEELYAVVGIQPNHVAEAQSGDLTRIIDLLDSPKVVGIGETGLDNYWDYAPKDLQIEYFDRHLELAFERDYPVVIHCRESEVEIADQLERFAEKTGKPIRGVMHSYCGNVESIQRIMKLGLDVSFSGMITFKKNEELRELVRSIPIERTLVETDSPYLAPHPNRGKTNQPAWVKFVGECMAQVHGKSIEEAARITTSNAKRLFSIP